MFSEVSSVVTNDYEPLTSLPVQTNCCYTFKGCFLDDETFLKDVCTITTFSNDTTVYAKWVQVVDLEAYYKYIIQL